MTKRTAEVLALFAVFSAVIALDQTSKEHVTRTLLVAENPTDTTQYEGKWLNVFMIGSKDPDPGETFYFLSLRIHYSRNHGMAFGLLADLDRVPRMTVLFLAYAVGLAVLLFLLRIAPSTYLLTRLGLVFMLAGAVSNIVDRLHRGFVVDFVQFDWELFTWFHDFAIFNLADVALNGGVLLIATDFFIQRRHQRGVTG